MAELSFRVLGALEVRSDESVIPIKSVRQRVVLTMLLMSPDHVVTMSQLIDGIWENPPPTARSQIHICISALRRALEAPDLITTHPNGYSIRLRSEQLDYTRFDKGLARGRDAVHVGRLEKAVEEFDEALARWRGPALAGLPGPAAQRVANRLEERRIAAVEERLQALLDLGAHRELIAELVTLTGDHPLRERLWGFLMLALYRSSRQSEALAAYRTVRRALVDQLGVEPGEELKRLERAILRHDRSLDVPGRSLAAAAATTPRHLPPDTPDFIGHTALLDSLTTLLTGDRPAGHVPVVVLTGMPGGGKSAVALRLAHLVRDHFPDGQLHADLRGHSPRPTPQREIAAQFLRALGVLADALPASHGERVNLLRSRLASRRVLIVLDDVASEQQIRELIPGVPGPAVIVTSRRRLVALPGAHVVEVGPLPATDSVRLIQTIVGAQSCTGDPAYAELAELCGGLPLALRIASMRLLAHPHRSLTSLVERLRHNRLDELVYGETDVRALLDGVHRGLSPRAQQLFRLLGQAQLPSVSASTVAAFLDCDQADGEQLLDELADARLLTVTASDQSPRYHLHELVSVFAAELAATRAAEGDKEAVERVLRVASHAPALLGAPASPDTPVASPSTTAIFRRDLHPRKNTEAGEQCTPASAALGQACAEYPASHRSKVGGTR